MQVQMSYSKFRLKTRTQASYDVTKDFLIVFCYLFVYSSKLYCSVLYRTKAWSLFPENSIFLNKKRESSLKACYIYFNLKSMN